MNLLDNATQIVIYIFIKQLNYWLNIADIGNGVTYGWVVIGVSIMIAVIGTILSRPFSNSVKLESKDKGANKK